MTANNASALLVLPSLDAIIDAHAADIDARITRDSDKNLIQRVVARLRAKGATVDGVTEGEREPLLAVCGGGRNGWNHAETITVSVDFEINGVHGAVVIVQVLRTSREFGRTRHTASQQVRGVEAAVGGSDSVEDIKAALGWR